jgi:hypothetical protein
VLGNVPYGVAFPDVTGRGNRDDDRSLCTSMPTNRVGCSMARLLCLRLHARPSGATLDHAHGETGHPFRAATGSSGEGSSARCCTDTDQAGSKGCALGGSRAEPWSCFPSPGSSGPETDMKSWLSGRLEPVWHHHQITMGQQLRSPPGRRLENLGVRRARIFLDAGADAHVPWLRRDWHTRFRNELLRRLVQADQWTFWIVRSLVNLQYILHAGYERGVGIRWDDPSLLQMRPEKVFLTSARSCCRWLGQRSSVPRPALPAVATSTAATLRRFGTGQGNQLRFGDAVKDARSGRGWRMLADKHGIEAFFHQLLAGPSVYRHGPAC